MVREFEPHRLRQFLLWQPTGPQIIWGSGRVADDNGLENRRRLIAARGFKSYLPRHLNQKETNMNEKVKRMIARAVYASIEDGDIDIYELSETFDIPLPYGYNGEDLATSEASDRASEEYTLFMEKVYDEIEKHVGFSSSEVW